jgi:hypothetical protein
LPGNTRGVRVFRFFGVRGGVIGVDGGFVSSSLTAGTAKEYFDTNDASFSEEAAGV